MNPLDLDAVRDYVNVTKLLTAEFMNDFCDDGVINWERIVRFNSGNLDLPEFLANEQ